MVGQRSDPIIVRVVEQPVHETGISDVILGSLGLVGVMLVCALILGALLGGGLVLYKRLTARDGIDPDHDAESLRVTPTAP
jgi:ABC-type phosphate transport system permease subunit